MMGETFLRDLGWMVMGAALFALVARRLNLPSLVAYLVVGLVLGPGTGWVQVTAELDLISEAGIVLLLFLVGLELSLDKIRGMGRAVLLAGCGQMILTFGLGWVLAWALGFAERESVFLALAAMLSSTVVAVKLLEEKHQFEQLHGRLAVGVLLLQDLAVIVVLTLLGGMDAQASVTWGPMLLKVAKAMGSMAALVAVVLLLSRAVLPRPFAWAARSPSTLLIWSLCWCFFVVGAAHALHLSPETGAFVAGLALAQLPYNHDLRRRVHPLMNFFVAVFFVSLGVKMELGAASAHWPAAVALILFVLVGKFAVVMGLLARLGFGERTGHHTALTLSQISEFSIILAAAAVSQGWVGTEVLSLVGVMGLATFSISACGIIYNQALYGWMRRRGILRVFRARPEPESSDAPKCRQGHIIVVGMNTLGRRIVRRLVGRGEAVLAVDTDPGKLSGLECDTLLGNVEYLSVLEEADLAKARLLVSALQIEPTNDLLAYRCRSVGVRCAILVVDLSLTDNLLEMDVAYLMVPKVDGIKLQLRELEQRGFLSA